MLPENLKKDLINELKDNDIEHFFAMSQQYLSEKSELQPILHLLANRTRKLKMDSLKRIISSEAKDLEHNKIVNELLEVIGLISNEDIKVVKVKINLEHLLQEIENEKNEFQKVIEDKSTGLIRIGQNLISLGAILREKSSPEDMIPLEEKIKVGTQKGYRRLKIGFLELRELKNAAVNGLQKITKSHLQLVEYLDFPEEAITDKDVEKLKATVLDLENFIQKINPEQNQEKEHIKKAKEMFDQVKPFQEQLGPSYDVFFQILEKIGVQCDEMIKFLEVNDEAFLATKTELQKINSELKINIKENQF